MAADSCPPVPGTHPRPDTPALPPMPCDNPHTETTV